MRFVKRPVIVDAIRLDNVALITTYEGTMRGNPGDWIITGVAGEQYPIKDEIFRKTYDPVDDDGKPISWDKVIE